MICDLYCCSDSVVGFGIQTEIVIQCLRQTCCVYMMASTDISGNLALFVIS